MIRPKTFFVSEGIIRDVENNNISVYNILENFNVEMFPVFISKIVFFTLWERDATDPDRIPARFNLTIDEEVLVTLEVEVNFAGQSRHRSIVYMNGIIVPRPGILNFRLTLENRVTSEYQVDILPMPTATVHAGTPNAAA